MYPILLALHSLVRWLVLPSLLFSIYRAYSGWSSGKSFSKCDETARLATVTITNIQVGIGIGLYAVSPIASYFSHNYEVAVNAKEMRFFGLEHVVMMLIAMTIISIGSVKVKNQRSDKAKFRTMAIWFTLGLLVVLMAIPWPFSPFANRPYFRLFERVDSVWFNYTNRLWKTQLVFNITSSIPRVIKP